MVPFLSVGAVAKVDITANVLATSNYVWRGMTQTDNQSAVQGGIDLSMGAFYVGAWTSNVLDDTEIDGYIGLKGKLSKTVEYDLGFIRYGYLDASSNNFNEGYIALMEKLSYGHFSVKYSKGMDDAPDDLDLGLSFSLPKHYSLDLSWGDYDTVATRYSAGLSTSYEKINFSATYFNSDFDASGKEDEQNIVVSVGTTF
jgi:uncharacterized protein (TIGR02001 family)